MKVVWSSLRRPNRLYDALLQELVFVCDRRGGSRLRHWLGLVFGTAKFNRMRVVDIWIQLDSRGKTPIR